MITRRHFVMSSAASLAIAKKSRAAARRKILIVLIDGFGPEYVQKSDMPNLKRLKREGAFKFGLDVIPSVTNVNNTSLVTGSFPKDHGVTTNYYYDPKTKKGIEMESADFVLKPTIFERAHALGLRTALVTSKDKVRTLCGRGADIQVSAEMPDQKYVGLIGKQENMYSPQVNYWSLRAARHVLKNESVDLMYLSTTDYMMHTYAAEEAPSLEHLHTLDKLLGEIVDDHPGVELYLTADHGMNRKDKGIDAARILKADSISAVAIATVRDKHVVHHQNMGGSCYVYLERKADLPRAVELLKATPGVTEIYEGAEAARLFQLYPTRVGDLLLLAAKDTVFGNLDQPLQEVKVRSHGSRFEQEVPLLVYGRKVDIDTYKYNLDLTRKLSLE